MILHLTQVGGGYKVSGCDIRSGCLALARLVPGGALLMEDLLWSAGDWRWGIVVVAGVLVAFSPDIYDQIRSWRLSREERERMKNKVIWMRMDFLQTQIDGLQIMKRDVGLPPPDEEEGDDELG